MTIASPATRDCSRCGGSGRFANGDCFACDGTGRYEIPSFHRNTGDTIMQNNTLASMLATFVKDRDVLNDDGFPRAILDQTLDQGTQGVDRFEVLRVNGRADNDLRPEDGRNDGRMLVRIGTETFTITIARTDGKG